MFYDLVEFADGVQAIREINAAGQITQYCDQNGQDIGRINEQATILSSVPVPMWGSAQDQVAAAPEVTQRPGARTVTKLEYLRRFTQQERVDIRTAAKVNGVLEDYLELLSLAEQINLDDADTIAGVNALEAAGLLSFGRAAEILGA